MNRYAYHLAGKDYGKLGRVLQTPPMMKITGFYVNSKGQKHGLDRAVMRDVTTADRLDALKNPIIVLEQANGARLGFLSERAMVVTTRTGELVTTYGRSDFHTTIQNILRDAGY